MVFWLVTLATGALGELRALTRRDAGLAFALGALGYGAQAGCYFLALDRLDASLLSLVLYTFPVMVAVAAIALGRERFSARTALALTVASAGLVLVLAGAAAGALDPLGTALALGAAAGLHHVHPHLGGRGRAGLARCPEHAGVHRRRRDASRWRGW